MTVIYVWGNDLASDPSRCPILRLLAATCFCGCPSVPVSLFFSFYTPSSLGVLSRQIRLLFFCLALTVSVALSLAVSLKEAVTAHAR